MITRIVLQNYMSHARTVIEPAAGLTVILGPNNCGKSAIVSALQTVCGDHSGDFMVRHGENDCSVTVETDDGHVISWRRVKKTTNYVIDGVEVTRTGRGNLPDDLQTFLRLPKVAHPSKDEEFDVHFAQQKQPIFLIDREADTAAFFSTASDAEKLLEMQKLHKSKVTDRRRAAVETKADLSGLEKQLSALAPLDELGPHLEALAAEEKALERLEGEIVALEELLAQIARQEQVVELGRQTAAALTPLQSPPVLGETTGLQALADELKRTAAKVACHTETTRVLSLLKPAPQLADLSSLAGLIERFMNTGREFAATGAMTQAMHALGEPPKLEDAQLLAEFTARLTVAMGHVNRARAWQSSLQALSPPPELVELAAMEEMSTKLQGLASGRLKQRHLLEEVLTHLERVEADIAAWLWANPNCPTCGQATSREHFLSSHIQPATLMGGETHG